MRSFDVCFLAPLLLGVCFDVSGRFSPSEVSDVTWLTVCVQLLIWNWWIGLMWAQKRVCFLLCSFSVLLVSVQWRWVFYFSAFWVSSLESVGFFLKLVYFFIGLLAYLYLFIANCFWYFSWSLDFGLFRLFFICCCCCLILIYLFDCLLVCLLSFLFILILFYVGSFLLYLMLLLDHSSLASRLFLKIHCSGFWWYAWILDFRPLGYSSILRSFHPSMHPPTRPSVRPSIFLSFICFIAMVFDTTPGS